MFDETPSEVQERQAGEGILMSSPDTILGAKGEDEDTIVEKKVMKTARKRAKNCEWRKRKVRS